MPSQYSSNRRILAEAKSFTGIDITYCENLVDLVWGSARPPRPQKPIFSLDAKYAGADHATKLARVRQELEKQKARALVVAMLDEVAWLFNLRGADIEFNPVFFAYAVVTADNAILFVNPDQVSQDVLAQLGQEVQLRPYDAIIPYLKELGSELQVRFFFLFPFRSLAQYEWIQRSASGWTESADRRQNERGGCRSNRTFLHQHRALADRGPQSYQERYGDRGFPRVPYQRRRSARAILCVARGAIEPGCQAV